MDFRTIALAGLILAAPIFCANAQSKKDPYSVDILGLHLGLRPDDVSKVVTANTEQPTAEPIQGSLTMGQFRIDHILYGYRVREGEKTSWYNTPNKEFIQINYTLNSDPKVMYIIRTRLFDENSAPTIAPLMKSISDKYGPASGQEGGGTQNTRLFWVFAPLPPRQVNPSQWIHSCGFELMYDANPFAQMRNGNVNYNPDYINNIWPKCGVSMIVDIEPMPSNSQIARSMTVSIGDYMELQKSDLYILDALRKGAAKKSDFEAKGHVLNEPHL
jgi:hypothetical protein